MNPSRLQQYLVQLHRQAGCPSMRRIADAIGSISHTTVHDVLRPDCPHVARWPTVAKVVEHLGGDAAHAKSLWAELADTVNDTGPEDLDLERHQTAVLVIMSVEAVDAFDAQSRSCIIVEQLLAGNADIDGNNVTIHRGPRSATGTVRDVRSLHTIMVRPARPSREEGA